MAATVPLFPGAAYAAPAISLGDLRGAIDAGEMGLSPDSGGDQSRILHEIAATAARKGQWVFLPPGRYAIADLALPDGARLAGIAGATRLVFAGGRSFLTATGAARIELSNITFDGGGLALADDVPALLHFRDTGRLLIDNCEITGTAKTGLQMEACGGRIERCRLAGIGEYGLYAIDSTGLSISGNSIEDCGNGGILVHRRNKGEDGTSVSGNRIARTGASYGGTGQFGNAVNIYRADAVSVTANHISDSAFTAIRANAASNVQISGNQCLRSGETAIYSEFGFEGAMVTGNLVDGAANGISIANFNEGGRLAVVASNIVRNITRDGPYEHDSVGFGIGIGVEADTAVSNNVVENVARWGLLVGWGPYLRNVAVTGNIIRAAKIGCAVSVADEPGSALISGNLFDRTPNGAIIGFRWHEPATGDLISGDHGFAHLTVAGNRAA